jgi:hypothetical protein
VGSPPCRCVLSTADAGCWTTLVTTTGQLTAVPGLFPPIVRLKETSQENIDAFVSHVFD